MKAEENGFLTQVEAGTPMGDYLRTHWVPVMRAARLEAGGAPVQARIFGDNYVAFRATDGRVGLIDEACPHRGASMALGRVEGCALRCLYHGWEVDVSGTFVHAVSEANGKPHGPNLSLRPYPVREAGNMIWAYLGKAEEAPRFPEYEWTKAAANARPHGAIVHCNWVQALEGALDPVHVGYLHSQWLPEFAVKLMQTAAIEYDVEDTPYGFSGAATRYVPNMPGLTRVKEYALPYYAFVPFEPLQERTTIFAIPIDRENCYLWYLSYDATEPQPTNLAKGATGVVGLRGQPKDVPGFQYGIDARLTQYPNPDNFRDSMPFDPDGLWGQDRKAMASGEHFTGLPGLTTEDIAVMESQGPVLDRTRERLGKGDILIVHMRRLLMQCANEVARGETHPDTDIDYGAIRSRMGFVLEGKTWRDVPRYAWELPGANVARPLEAAE